MQDLDIRGAGNLLGAEQSGFIADLGYETYQKILKESVLELKTEEFPNLRCPHCLRSPLHPGDYPNPLTTLKKTFMTELEMMRWILGILLAAGSLGLLVMYFYRESPSQTVVETEMGRSQLQIGLLSAANDRTESISSAILESDAYEALQQHIRKGSIMSESSPIWEELEKTILQSSPKFKSSLYVLAGGDLKPSDLHIALLVKCGVSPANMALLVGRSKSTITFRRKDIGKKLFDKDLDANAVDELIRLI